MVMFHSVWGACRFTLDSPEVQALIKNKSDEQQAIIDKQQQENHNIKRVMEELRECVKKYQAVDRLR
jgi:non-homologous end joining protein Ku